MSPSRSGTDGLAPSVHTTGGRSLSLLPGVDQSWVGRPGLAGQHVRLDAGAAGFGHDWAPSFRLTEITVTGGVDARRVVRVAASDDAAQLGLTTEIEAVDGGLLRIRHTITNHAVAPYLVHSLDVTVPVPDRVAELLDFSGRWGRERTPQRRPITDGLWLRESRGGRTGHSAATQLLAGTAGFGFGHGDIWAVHVGWSGNSRHFLERLPSGLVTLGGGEVLLPGEVVLATGQSYSTPWVFVAASAAGADALAAQFHRYLRALPAHPRSPRPVVSNVWEAVYFDHDLGRLTHLADLAAQVGIERIVLDDGWFGSRRNDRAGLGDWTVSDEAWPEGLTPFTDHVQALGLQFGLWFEPEMVNPDSDLYRAHPEWILGVAGRTPTQFRNQLVLDLGRPEVRDHLFSQIDAVLSTYPIVFVKWDHNRELPEAAGASGTPGAHAQTVGFYDLLDRLRAAHPHVEWESCASGGGRIDLGVLERVERVWTSDMTDALARQGIQRWTAQLVPPEYLGAHISATTNHQTGRTLTLDFRAATAFFGDLGVEWDIAAATDAERERLAGWIALYKQHRPLLHSGIVCRVDSSDESIWINGVRAADRSHAIMGYFQLDEATRDPLPLLVPGLDPARRYRVDVLEPAAESASAQVTPDAPPQPWRGDGMVLSGAALASVGLPAPHRWTLTALLISVTAVT